MVTKKIIINKLIVLYFILTQLNFILKIIIIKIILIKCHKLKHKTLISKLKIKQILSERKVEIKKKLTNIGNNVTRISDRTQFVVMLVILYYS